MSNIVEVDQLTKMYGDLTVINDVSLAIKEGKIYGLLGRNGAGKTTLMGIVAAQLFATSGTVRVFGEDPYESKRVLSQMCFIKENQKYPQYFRALDVLELSAAFFPAWDHEHALSLAEDFQLPLKRRIKALSRGMRSALGCIVGLASRAPLTLFDEPYLGLDVVNRAVFYNRLIEDYAEYPRTIVLSTHLIDEISRLLEHVIIIDRGKVLINEEAEVLRGWAFTVIGAEAKIKSFIAEGTGTILKREQIGSLASVTMLSQAPGSGSKKDILLLETGDQRSSKRSSDFTREQQGMDERKRAEVLGLEFAPVSLQQLVVHLTGGTFIKEGVPAI